MTAKYHCNYCDEDIKKIRVKCGECPDFDLCIKCFSSGAEIGNHKSKHKYQLIDCGTFPIFDSSLKWKASEELALLEAVELYGFGNWNDIAEFIGSKNANEVKEHFIKYYIYGNIGKYTWDVFKNNKLDIKDHTCVDDRPLSPSFLCSLPEISDLEPIKQQQLGYMPKRDDFETEYDNDAERIISFLTISNEDDEIDSELKATQVDIYKQKLSERFRRKAIARDYNLVYLFFKTLEEDDLESDKVKFFLPNKESKEEELKGREDIEIKIRLLSQFQSQAEQKLLIDNLHKEYLLKQKLKELLKIRKNNLKKLNKNKDIKNTKKKENKKTKMNLMENIGSAPKSTFSLVKIKDEFQKNMCQSVQNDSSTNKNGSFKTQLKKTISNHVNTNHENVSNKNSQDNCDVYSLRSSRLLSEQEKKFCNTMKLRPSQYINFKTLILKEHVQKKGKSSNTGKSVLENIDKITHKKMINFMTKCGWLTN